MRSNTSTRPSGELPGRTFHQCRSITRWRTSSCRTARRSRQPRGNWRLTDEQDIPEHRGPERAEEFRRFGRAAYGGWGMTVVKMPQLGESVTEGTILQWMKAPGDAVRLDDPLCEIETKKVTAELPSPFEGTMGQILVPQGETVEVGTPLCEVVEAAVPASAPATGDGKWLGGPMAIPPP